MTETRRSLALISRNHLLQLAALAAEAEAGFFARRPHGRALRRSVAVPGAVPGSGPALPGRENRHKDFDVWSFYAARSDGPFPCRWRGWADFGPSRFGRHPGDPSYSGRRVDVLGRSLSALPGAGPGAVLRDYLAAARTRSAKALPKRSSSSPQSTPPVKSSGLWAGGSPRSLTRRRQWPARDGLAWDCRRSILRPNEGG